MEQHRGLPHSFRLTPTEDALLKELVQRSKAKSESEFMRRLLLGQAELYSLDYVPKIEGQSAFEFVPRLTSWKPLERFVRAHARAERVEGGEPPQWAEALDASNGDNHTMGETPQVCCANPLPVIVGTSFFCARCEQPLPIAGALALVKWRAKRVERTNKPLHEELNRQAEVMEQLEKLERMNPAIRKARTNLVALYQHPVMVEPVDNENDAVNEWPFVDVHRAMWDVLNVLDRNQYLSVKQIAALVAKDEINVNAAVDMGVDDGWMTHKNQKVIITKRGRKYLQCTSNQGAYRPWQQMDAVWARMLDLLASSSELTTEDIATTLGEDEDVVHGVLVLSEMWEWVKSPDYLRWGLVDWLRPLGEITKTVLGRNWTTRQKDFWLPGGERTAVAGVNEELKKLQTLKVAGPVPSTTSTSSEVQVEEVAGPVPSTTSTSSEVQVEEVAGPVPSTTSTSSEVQVEEVAGPVPSTTSTSSEVQVEEVVGLVLSTSDTTPNETVDALRGILSLHSKKPKTHTTKKKTATKPPKTQNGVVRSEKANVVLRSKMKGARKALIHVVAACNPITTTQWFGVCGEALEPMGFPAKNGVMCSACESMRDARAPLLEQDLPLVKEWVRLWDQKHDLAHTKRKKPFWGSDNIAVCNVVLDEGEKNGASSKWKLAPEGVRDCAKCASLRDKPNTLGAPKAVAS